MKFELDNIPSDWLSCFDESKLKSIEARINDAQIKYKGLDIYPNSSDIFKSFLYVSFEKLKIVILGQDCYHGKNQANGLCFSVNDDIRPPPSLRNIIKEMKNDGIERTSGDFTNLAKQGILFLNSSLTVHEKLPGSHLEIWEDFTDNIIQFISKNSKNNIVFILWGNYAKNKAKFIDDRHLILSGTHPSPLAANRGGFFNNLYFSKANQFLIQNNIIPIDWTM